MISVAESGEIESFLRRDARPGLDPGIVAGIHVFLAGSSQQDSHGRGSPGHDCGEPCSLHMARNAI